MSWSSHMLRVEAQGPQSSNYLNGGGFVKDYRMRSIANSQGAHMALEDLGLMMEQSREVMTPVSSRGDGTIQMGGCLPGGDPEMQVNVSLQRFSQQGNDTVWMNDARNHVNGASGQSGSNWVGHSVASAHSNLGHVPNSMETPRTNGTGPYGINPSVVWSNHRPVPGGKCSEQILPTIGLTECNGNILCLSNSASASNWVVVQNSTTTTNWNVVGTVVKLRKDQQMVNTHVNAVRLQSEPPLNVVPNGSLTGYVGGVASDQSQINPTLHFALGLQSLRNGVGPFQVAQSDQSFNQNPSGSVQTIGHDSTLRHGAQFEHHLNNYTSLLGGSGLVNHQLASGRAGVDPPHTGILLEQAETTSFTSGNLQLQSTGLPLKVTNESILRRYLDDRLQRAEEARKALMQAKNGWQPGMLTANGAPGSENAFGSSHQIPQQSPAANLKQGKRNNKTSDTSEQHALSPSASKHYQPRKSKKTPVVEGDTEEIVVEVDLPTFYDSDSEEEEIAEVRGDSVNDDPLAPSNDDVVAVNCMRVENITGNSISWNGLLTSDKDKMYFKRMDHAIKINMLRRRKESVPEPVGWVHKRTYLDGEDESWENTIHCLEKSLEKTGGKSPEKKGRPRVPAAGVSAKQMTPKGKKNEPDKVSLPTGRVPEVMRKCFVRLVRCDSTVSGIKPRPSSSKGNEIEVPPQQSSPSPSSSTRESEVPPKRDYWLQVLDRERREALEALEAVRKRLDEEKSTNELSLDSVHSSLLERELSDKASSVDEMNALSFDERRWNLLEEEFRKQEANRRKSVSIDTDNSVLPAPLDGVSGAQDDLGNCSMEKQSNSQLVPHKSSKVIICCKDMAAPTAAKSSPRNGLSLSLKGDGINVRSGVVEAKRCNVASRGIKDARISELQKKAQEEQEKVVKSSAVAAVSKLKNCSVLLERCDPERWLSTKQPSSPTEGGVAHHPEEEGTAVCIDSIEMRSVAMSTGPVPNSDGTGVSQTSFVCLQSCVGISTDRVTQDSSDKKGSLSSHEASKQAVSSYSDSTAVSNMVMVEMKKLVVVVEKFDELRKRCLRHSERSQSQKALAIEPNRGKDSKALISVSRGRYQVPEILNSQLDLKRCYVRLVRCDEQETVVNRDAKEETQDDKEVSLPKKRKLRRVI